MDLKVYQKKGNILKHTKKKLETQKRVTDLWKNFYLINMQLKKQKKGEGSSKSGKI